MKKIVITLLAAVLCLGIAGCGVKDDGGVQDPDPVIAGPAAPVEPVQVAQAVPEEIPEPEPVWTAAEGVTFALLQDSYPVGTTKLTLVAENQTGEIVYWGTCEFYEKFVDGQWQKLDYPEGTAFTDEAFRLRPESVRVQTLHCLSLLPPLEEGLYRVTGGIGGVHVGEERYPDWQVSFRVAADAVPEPDYNLYISSQPIPTVDGCAVTDRIRGYFINTTGEDASVLLIPHLERLEENGEWAEVPWKEGVGFCGMPDPLPEEGKEWSWELSMLWGSLDDGQYRIGVRCQPYLDTEVTVYGEFTLYTPENNAGLPLAPQE